MDYAFIEAFIAPVRDSVAAQVGITAVFVLMLLDVLFGVGNAIAKKEYSSSKMREGIGHKCGEIGFIIVGIVVDATIIGGVELGVSAPVLVTICVYIIVMEVGSLLETFALMNPDLANSPLFRLLESVTHKEDDDD